MSDISASFVSIDQSSNITSKKTYVQQLVDILSSDICATNSSTRKMYEVFVTGGTGQNTVTSSLYQTVYDQDFDLNTSNALFDLTTGVFAEKQTADDGTITYNILDASFDIDSSGKISYNNSDYLMIREKNNIYRQYAQNLLGDPDAYFVAPFGETYTLGGNVNKIRNALFFNFRRLFVRDNIYKGSFAMNIYKNCQTLENDKKLDNSLGDVVSNLLFTTDDQEFITLDDVAKKGYSISPVSGEVATLLNSAGEYIGLIFYDKGVIVLDIEKSFDIQQKLRGLIESVSLSQVSAKTGPWMINAVGVSETSESVLEGNAKYYNKLYTTQIDNTYQAVYCKLSNGGQIYTFYYNPSDYADFTTFSDSALDSFTSFTELQPLFSETQTENIFYSDDTVVADANSGYELFEGTLNEFCLKATIDDILSHFCTTRFGNNDASSIVFRNETVINSSFIFCRAAPSQLNYSTNPTYTDDNGTILAVDSSGQPFSFVTTIGLYDTTGTLVAVAKTSRPIEKNAETDLSLRIRLDY